MSNLIEILGCAMTDGPIKYKDRMLYTEDEIPIIDGDGFCIIIEKMKKKPKIFQGFLVDLKKDKSGDLFVDNTTKGCGGVEFISKDGNDTGSKTFIVYNGKPNFLGIKNIWEERRPELGYISTNLAGGGSACMVIEHLPDSGRRYHCNDGESDEDFDDIIFSIRPIKKENKSIQKKFGVKKRNLS
jgi:hypothetical protein